MNKSFTLIEILVVIVVIGVLSAFILVGMSSITRSANIAKSQAFLNSIDNSLLLGRVSQWKLDERTTAGHGDTFIDSWGSNTGTLYTNNGTNNKVSSDCPSGKCLSFDGTDDYVDIGNDKFNYQQFTVSHWIKTSTVTIVPFSNYYRQAAGQPEYGWFTTIRSNGRPSIQINSNAYTPPNGPLVNDNIWHLITIIVNGANAIFYTDGVQVSTYTYSSAPSYAVSVETYIGAKYEGAINGNFSGSIDDIRIYNQAISTSQIQQNYYIGLNRLYNSNNVSKQEYMVKIKELLTQNP